MAADEVLLESAAETGRLIWRFYQWSEPTLSLGYFQVVDDRAEHPASRNCPAVRRPSGGGAILHHVELTYSFVVPAAHPLASRRHDLYETAHLTLIDTLRDWAVTARLCGPVSGEAAGRQPFLCFQRRSPGDILIDSTKIAGSAQRRVREAVLQHGSVLLGRSPAAPELAGIQDASGVSLRVDGLVAAWRERLAERLRLSWFEEPFSSVEQRQAERLITDKYASDAWTRHRGRVPS